MRKALTLLAVLAVVVPSMAGITLFWSTTGISNPALQYSTAQTNFSPAFVNATQAPATLDPGTYDLFLWGQFGADIPAYAQIYGLDLANTSTATVGDNVAYRHLRPSPPPAMAWHRWDGSQGIALDGVMAAVTSQGIQFYQPGDTLGDLYNPADGTFLIGAAHVTGAAGQILQYSIDNGPGGLGIAVRPGPGEPDITPDPVVTPATVTFIPEPASMLLLALGALLRRR